MPCAVRTKSRAPELGTCRLHALLIHTELGMPPTWLLKTKLIHIQEQACSIRQESEGRTMVFNHLSREEFWQSTGLPCPGGTSGKEPACQGRGRKRHRFDPGVGKIPLEEGMATPQVFLPGESHGQSGLAGYNPWGQTQLK